MGKSRMMQEANYKDKQVLGNYSYEMISVFLLVNVIVPNIFYVAER